MITDNCFCSPCDWAAGTLCSFQLADEWYREKIM
jgi:hypothetical protein